MISVSSVNIVLCLQNRATLLWFIPRAAQLGSLIIKALSPSLPSHVINSKAHTKWGLSSRIISLISKQGDYAAIMWLQWVQLRRAEVCLHKTSFPNRIFLSYLGWKVQMLLIFRLLRGTWFCQPYLSLSLFSRSRLQNENSANRWYQSADTDMVRQRQGSEYWRASCVLTNVCCVFHCTWL